MFCTKCGTGYKQSEKFCTGCGDEIHHTAGIQPDLVVSEKNNTNQQFKKRSIRYWLIPISILIVGIGGIINFFYNQGKDKSEADFSVAPETQTLESKDDFNNDIDEESLISITKTYLDILWRIYHITQDNSPTNPETATSMIIGMTTETLKDKADMESLLLKVNKMKTSNVDVISTTGLVIEMTLQQLIKSHTEWAQYLRTVNEDTVEIAEFQYQMASFNSQNKQAFMSLGENTALYPGVFFNLSEEENTPGTWKLSEESKNEILLEIDRLFADIFIEDEKNYEATQTHNVVVFIVKNLRGYFAPESTDTFENSVQ